MFKILLPIYFLLQNLTNGIKSDVEQGGFKRDKEHRVKKVVRLSQIINEGSGFILNERNAYVISDSGNPSVLYELNSNYTLVKADTLTWPNYDWEELAYNHELHEFYIGDIGNNCNCRKDLAVHVWSSEKQPTRSIALEYANQTAFPPSKQYMNYDAEAMVYAHDSLFMFSKNRGDYHVAFYAFSIQDTRVLLRPIQFQYMKTMITGAAYHEPSKTLVLLGYGKLFWFSTNNGIARAQPEFVKKIPFCGQVEAIAFNEQGELFLTNEKGKVYQVLNRK
jgi:hypothetical protein